MTQRVNESRAGTSGQRPEASGWGPGRHASPHPAGQPGRPRRAGVRHPDRYFPIRAGPGRRTGVRTCRTELFRSRCGTRSPGPRPGRRIRPGNRPGRRARHRRPAQAGPLAVPQQRHPGGCAPGRAADRGWPVNLTYLVDARAAAGPEAPLLVLRRPPLGHVLPTAHDMGREYQVLSALRGTAVPVPPVAGKCTDPAVIGAPFYVMGYVPGLVLRTRGGRGPGQPGPGPAAVGKLRRHAGRYPRRGPGGGRADRLRPAGWLHGAAAGPLAAPVGAVQHPGHAWIRRADPSGCPPALPRGGRGRPRHPGPRRLPAGQHAGHAGQPAGRSRPWWTGRCPRWAIRWPTWA